MKLEIIKEKNTIFQKNILFSFFCLFFTNFFLKKKNAIPAEPPSGQVGDMSQSFLPIAYFLGVASELILMLSQALPITTSLSPYVGGIHPAKDWNNELLLCFPALKDLHKFFKAPRGRSEVFGENNDWNPWFLNCLKNNVKDLVATLEPIIEEGPQSRLPQSSIEITCEGVARVFPSKTQKNIVAPLLNSPFIRHLNQTIKQIG